MRGGEDKVIVRLDRRFRDGLGVKGHNGEELVMHPSFLSTKHKVVYGEIVGLPVSLSVNKPFTQIGNYVSGEPHYKYYPDCNWEDLKVGQLVYFAPQYNDISHHLEDDCFAVNLRHIYCTVKRAAMFDFEKMPTSSAEATKEMVIRFQTLRQYKDFATAKRNLFPYDDCVRELPPILEMIGSRVLVEKVWPEDVTVNEHGTPERKTKSGLILLEEVRQTDVKVADDPDDINDFVQNQSARIKMEIRPIQGQGILRHIGKPLKGMRKEASTGDRVLFKKIYQHEIEIEGKSYWVMLQQNLEGVING